MRLLLATVFVLAAWKWSNWKNWKEYYPTIQFMILLAVLEGMISANHHLWIQIKDPFDSVSLNSLLISFTCFPATVLLYLSHYPTRKLHQIGYVLMWILINCGIELVMQNLGLIIYDKGWSFAWPALVNILMFPLLRIHHTRPLVASGLSVAFFVFFWIRFGFSIGMLE